MSAPIAVLSLQQTPPLSVSFRFFLSAPLFLLLAALLLLFSGPDALVSRWTPTMLALTHLVALGFLTMIMIGALMQMLPVVADAPMRRPRFVAWTVHICLVAGTAMLASGLFFSDTGLLMAAGFPLLLALGMFLIAAVYSLAGSSVSHATTRTMYFSGLALALTAALGIALLGIMSGYFNLPLLAFVKLHIAWGLLGWIGLLVIGIAYQVVPMFQLTPAYPAAITRWLDSALFALLCGLSLAVWLPLPVASGIAIGFTLFAAATLYLQKKRRRRVTDVTLQFWRMGMFSLLAAVVLWAAAQQISEIAESPRYPIILGMLFIFGFAVSVANGMLYKIVPFLIWLNLQSRLAKDAAIPNMKQIIPDHTAQRQLRAHMATLLLLLASTAWPVLIYPAALALALASCLLLLNLVVAARLNRKFSRL